VIRKLPVSLAVAALFSIPRVVHAQTTPAPILAPAPAPVPTPVVTPAPPLTAAPPPVLAPAEPPATTVYVTPAPAPAPSTSPIELMTLKVMLQKGILTKAEYESALKDLSDTSGEKAALEGSVVMGKWSTTLYGFAEADYIWDSTRAFNDLAGAAQIPRAGTQGGDNGRVQFGIRNSRFGVRLRAPETAGIRASSVFEWDFMGTQLPVANPDPAPTPVNAAGTEATYFTSPVLRVRHLYLKVETPVVDFLAGQYWALFGWGSAYQPNTVEIQGVPGEIYVRTPQLRISKTLKADPVTLELAVAATRPVQRDSTTPDGQAGIRFSVDSWTGLQTTGSTGTQISPFSIAATGLLRHVAVDAFSASPKTTNDRTLTAIAFDGYLPIIPASKDHKGNALSVQGEFATGYGDADMYTGLTGGISFPALPIPAGMTAAPAYAADIDNGIVTYDSKGGLHGIQWTSWLVGGQYYFPGVEGKAWVSGNYSHIDSANTHYYGTPSKVRLSEDWFDVNLFVEPVPAVRIGAEYANFKDTYVDGQHAINHRAQLSSFFIF
jgi:hypothetical protein